MGDPRINIDTVTQLSPGVWRGEQRPKKKDPSHKTMEAWDNLEFIPNLIKGVGTWTIGDSVPLGEGENPGHPEAPQSAKG